MEIKVTVELGPKTFALLNGFNAQVVGAEKENITVEKVEADEAAPTEKPKQTRTRTSKAKEEAAETSKETATTKVEAFEDLDDDAKLEAIKAEVTKHTKKGKSADIKALLLGFDANRASELAPEDYDAFYDAVKRYGAGESVDDIVGLN